MDRYERERLEEQNDMLIEENAQLLQLNHILNETSVENEREIERLRKDLQCYGSHANTCDSAYKHSGGIRAKCTCGFDEALKE